VSFLTAYLEDPAGYGRIIRQNGKVRAIVEETEADERTRGEQEVNAGLYAAEARWLWPALEGVRPGPHGERYLTDILAQAVSGDERVEVYQVGEASEVQQVNTRVELARAERILRERIRRRLMLDGVTLIDPDATYVDYGVSVGEDTTLHPGVHLIGGTSVGARCRIGPNAVLRDSHVGDECEIGGSTIEGSTIHDRVTIGPYCHLRPGCLLEHDVHLGNYAELKASHVGPRTKIGHFSYLGDADVGADVNYGAGAITANYDGAAKHRTRIGDGAFIGSDTMLVAPIEIGARAVTGAASVVTRDVPADATAIGAPARIMRNREEE
jgi:bifunctional UDP-N-acetylglucosamine pyrophosphorylase/glucosamine-1-phosphate N-acetyltransferase